MVKTLTSAKVKLHSSDRELSTCQHTPHVCSAHDPNTTSHSCLFSIHASHTLMEALPLLPHCHPLVTAHPSWTHRTHLPGTTWENLIPKLLGLPHYPWTMLTTLLQSLPANQGESTLTRTLPSLPSRLPVILEPEGHVIKAGESSSDQRG